MDEKKKKYIVAGVIVGTVTVGLVILAKRTPRDKWGSTLLRIAKDGLSVVKSRYGNNEIVGLVEKTIDQLQDSGMKLVGDGKG